ncbi:MAG TPA: periplasmic heavy metal sensor [Flavipsychrobacter sp.]|nr:periplasmic heavy metal sensor [Flavipsychrobacter sp.]
MKNEHFYKIVIIMLLLLNAGVLGYLWLHNDDRKGPPHGPHMRPDQMIIERIGLDDKQQEAFRVLKDEHHNQMIDIQGADSKLHTDLFALLKQDPVDSVLKDDLLAKLKTNDSLKEEMTFDHFRKLRAVLRPEQQPKLDELVAELAGRIMGNDHRRPPPPR